MSQNKSRPSRPMPFSHYYGLWKNIPHCLTQIQMGLAGRLPIMETGFFKPLSHQMCAISRTLSLIDTSKMKLKFYEYGHF